MTAPILTWGGLKPFFPKHRTWSVVSDDRQSGWYDSGWGVRCDQDGILENQEPLSMRRAEELWEELEERE